MYDTPLVRRGHGIRQRHGDSNGRVPLAGENRYAMVDEGVLPHAEV